MAEGNGFYTSEDTDACLVASFHDQSTYDSLEFVDSSLLDLKTCSEEDAWDMDSLTSSLDMIDDETEVITPEEFTFEHEDPSVEQAMKFLPTVKRMGRKDLVDKLEDVLMKALSTSNCLLAFQLAVHCDLDDLLAASRNMICTNFYSMIEMPQFCSLSLKELNMILYSDILNATEEHVFQAIVRWVSADLRIRNCFMPTLLSAVRLDRCSLRFLKSVVTHLLVQKEHSFVEAAEKRMKLLISSGLNQDSSGTEASTGGRSILVVMGGFENIESVETLDPARGSWVSHRLENTPKHWTWICSTGFKILVLEWENERFRSFDVTTRKWTPLRSPPHYVFGSSRSFSGDHVYIVGGEAPHRSRCDRYDVSKDRWDEMPRMSERREWPASVCHAGKLYCSGGFIASTYRDHASLEALDLLGDGQWFQLAPMRVRRCQHSLVSCGRFLWSIGGWHHRKCISDVEKYDVETDQWTSVRSLTTAVQFFSATVFKGRIHVIGGEKGDRRGFQLVSLVQVYDEAEDKWTYGERLLKRRNFHGSCVVRFPSDADPDQKQVPSW